MQTRLQRVGRGVVAPCAAVLLGLSALGVTTAEAASPEQGGCSIGVLGVCLVGASSTPAPGATLVAPMAAPAQVAGVVVTPPTPTPTPRPAPTPTPRVAAATATPPPRTPAPTATPPSGLGGLLGGVVGMVGGSAAPAGSGSSATTASAPSCTLNLLGNCLNLTPSPAPSNGTGLNISLPTGSGGSQQILGIGQQGCVAALVGSCVVGNTQSNPGSCVASLLTLCVPNVTGTTLPTQTCVANGLLCVGPTTAATPAATQGASPTQPAAGGGGVATPAGTVAPSAAGGVPTSGLPSAPSTTPQPQPARDAIPSIETAPGALAGFAGLHLGSIFVWPVFAVLDLLAAAALIRLARRSRTAAPAD